MKYVLIGLIILFLIWSIYIYLVYPIITLFNCAKREDFSFGKKAAWFVGVFLTWTIGAAIFRIFNPDRTLHRVHGSLIITGIIAFCGIGIYYYPVRMNKSVAYLSQFQSNQDIYLAHLASQQKQEFKRSIQKVKEGVTFHSWSHSFSDLKRFIREGKYQSMTKILKKAAKDGKIDSKEYQDWMAIYRAIDVISGRDLRKTARKKSKEILDVTKVNQRLKKSNEILEAVSKCINTNKDKSIENFIACQKLAKVNFDKGKTEEAFTFLWTACRGGVTTSCELLGRAYIRGSQEKFAKKAAFYPCMYSNQPKEVCSEIFESAKAKANQFPKDQDIWGRMPASQ